MDIYNKALGDDKEFSKITAMKKYLGYSDSDVEENFKNLIKEKQLAEYTDYIGSQVSEKEGLVGWDPPIKFKADYKLENKDDTDEKSTDDSDSDEAGNDEGEDEASEPADTSVPEEKESSAPTFGLG
jgi:hypothetical protein